MMAQPGRLTRHDVAHVAALARLHLSDEELDLFTGQLGSILDHAADVASLDLTGVAPTAHAMAVTNVLRPDLALHDISLSFELVAALKFADPGRTAELRRRYLALILDGMRATGRDQLPGSPPGWPEISERWNAS